MIELLQWTNSRGSSSLQGIWFSKPYKASDTSNLGDKLSFIRGFQGAPDKAFGAGGAWRSMWLRACRLAQKVTPCSLCHPLGIEASPHKEGCWVGRVQLAKKRTDHPRVLQIPRVHLAGWRGTVQFPGCSDWRAMGGGGGEQSLALPGRGW